MAKSKGSKSKSKDSSKSNTDKKKKKKDKDDGKSGKLLCMPIKLWMYLVLAVFFVATLVICIRGLKDYGFTLDSIPNFILIILLLIVLIIIVFAITTERKPFIMPLIGLIIALAVLTVLVFFYRVYVFVRDAERGITYAVLMVIYAAAFFIITFWKRYIKKRKSG